MKIIPYFYYSLAILSLIGGFILMADSGTSIYPIYFCGGGIFSALLFGIFGVLSQMIIKTAEVTKNTAEVIDHHTEALKFLTKRKRSK